MVTLDQREIDLIDKIKRGEQPSVVRQKRIAESLFKRGVLGKARGIYRLVEQWPVGVTRVPENRH